MSVSEIQGNVFDRIGKQWMLVGAMKDGKANAMTASWGGMGVLWGKNVVFVFVRKSRYTKEFIDAGDNFSLSFFGEEHRGMLGYMGKVSGRDEDKIAKSGLQVSENQGAPVFAEAELTLICKKLYEQEIEKSGFLSEEEVQKWYGDDDYHTMYVAEIVQVCK